MQKVFLHRTENDEVSILQFGVAREISQNRFVLGSSDISPQQLTKAKNGSATEKVVPI